jgi:ribosomal protein S12 methylthiotransferase
MHADPALRVSEEDSKRREGELMELQQSIAFENALFVAEQRSEFDVLIDGPARGATKGRATTGVNKATLMFTGRAYHQAPAIDGLTHVISREPLAAGELVRCTVVDSDGYDLVAQPSDDLDPSIRLPVIK